MDVQVTNGTKRAVDSIIHLPPLGLTPEQLAMRRTGVGSSETAALLGVDPRRNAFDIYCDKVGLAEPWEGNRFTRWGQKLEAVIAEAWCEAKGRRVVKPTPPTIRHPKHSVALCSIDYEALDGDDVERVVECKNVGTFMRDEWGEDGTDQIPEKHILQVNWQLGIRGLAVGDVAALFGGNDLHIYTLAFDPELFGIQVEAAERFWRDNVVPQKPPEIDGSTGATEYLARRFPKSNGVMLPATGEAREQLAAYQVARDQAKAAEAAKAAARNRLAEIVGDADGITGLVTFKSTKSGGVDWRGLAETFGPPPALVKQFTRPGHRVIRDLTSNSKEE